MRYRWAMCGTGEEGEMWRQYQGNWSAKDNGSCSFDTGTSKTTEGESSDFGKFEYTCGIDLVCIVMKRILGRRHRVRGVEGSRLRYLFFICYHLTGAMYKTKSALLSLPFRCPVALHLHLVFLLHSAPCIRPPPVFGYTPLHSARHDHEHDHSHFAYSSIRSHNRISTTPFSTLHFPNSLIRTLGYIHIGISLHLSSFCISLFLYSRLASWPENRFWIELDSIRCKSIYAMA